MDLEDMTNCSEDGDVLDINIEPESYAMGDYSDGIPEDSTWQTNDPATEEPKMPEAPAELEAPSSARKVRMTMTARRGGGGNPYRPLRRQPGSGFRGTGRSPAWKTPTAQQAQRPQLNIKDRLGVPDPWLPGHGPRKQPDLGLPGPVRDSIPPDIGNSQKSGHNFDSFLPTELAATHHLPPNVQTLTMGDVANLDIPTKRLVVNSIIDYCQTRRAGDAQNLGSPDPTQRQDIWVDDCDQLLRPVNQDLPLPNDQNNWSWNSGSARPLGMLNHEQRLYQESLNRQILQDHLGRSLTAWMKRPSIGLGLHEQSPNDLLSKGLATVAPVQRKPACRVNITPVQSSVQFQQTPSRANLAEWASTPFNRVSRSAGTNFSGPRGFGPQRSRVVRSKPQRFKSQEPRFQSAQSKTSGNFQQNSDSTLGLDSNLSERRNSFSVQTESQNVDSNSLEIFAELESIEEPEPLVEPESLVELRIEPVEESIIREVTGDSLSVALKPRSSGLMEPQRSAATLPEPRSIVAVPQQPAPQAEPLHSVTAAPEMSSPPALLSVGSISAEILVPPPAVPRTEPQLPAISMLPDNKSEENKLDICEARESVQFQHQHPVLGSSLCHSSTLRSEVVPSGPRPCTERELSESQQANCACSKCRRLKVERPMARCEHAVYADKGPGCDCCDSSQSTLKSVKYRRSSSPPFASLQQSRSRRSDSSSSDCSGQCYRHDFEERQKHFLDRREQELFRIERKRREEARRLQAMRWQEMENARHKAYHRRSRSPESYGHHRSDRYSSESRHYKSNKYRPRNYERHHYERDHSENYRYNFHHRTEHYHRDDYESNHYHPEQSVPKHHRQDRRLDHHVPTRHHPSSYRQALRPTEVHSESAVKSECLRSADFSTTKPERTIDKCETFTSAESRTVVTVTVPERSALKTREEQDLAALLEKKQQLEAEMERVQQVILQKKHDTQVPHP